MGIAMEYIADWYAYVAAGLAGSPKLPISVCPSCGTVSCQVNGEPVKPLIGAPVRSTGEPALHITLLQRGNARMGQPEVQWGTC